MTTITGRANDPFDNIEAAYESLSDLAEQGSSTDARIAEAAVSRGMEGAREPAIPASVGSQLIQKILQKDLDQADIMIRAETRNWKITIAARWALIAVAVVLVIWAAALIMQGGETDAVMKFVTAAGAIVTGGAGAWVYKVGIDTKRDLEKSIKMRASLEKRILKLTRDST